MQSVAYSSLTDQVRRKLHLLGKKINSVNIFFVDEVFLLTDL